MGNLNEVKLKAEYFCGDGLTNTLFAMLLNSCLRELSPIAKKEMTDVFPDVVETVDKGYSEVLLTEKNVQIMSVIVDTIPAIVVGQQDFPFYRTNFSSRSYHRADGLIYAIDQDTLFIKCHSPAKEIRVKYYVPLIQYDVTNAEAKNWILEPIPFREEWFSDLIVFYITRDFFANFEDEDNVRLYQIMYDRELKRFKDEVARRHLNNSRRYSLPNGFI